MGDQALDRFEFESMQPSLTAFMGKDNHKNLSVNVGNMNSNSAGKATKNERERTEKVRKSGGGFGKK